MPSTRQGLNGHTELHVNVRTSDYRYKYISLKKKKRKGKHRTNYQQCLRIKTKINVHCMYCRQGRGIFKAFAQTSYNLKKKICRPLQDLTCWDQNNFDSRKVIRLQLKNKKRTARLGTWMNFRAKGVRRNTTYLITRCTIYCDIKKGMMKMYLLLKLTQVPWSIETMLDLCLLVCLILTPDKQLFLAHLNQRPTKPAK